MQIPQYGDDLVDILYQKLTRINIFSRLIRHAPVRQRLFKCMARVISHGKPVALMLQQNFIDYIKQKHYPERTPPTITATNAAYMLATLAKAKLKILDREMPSVPSEVNLCNSETMCQNNLNNSYNLHEDSNAEPPTMLPLCTEAITLGIQLGTFLFESGWLSESVGVLSTVAQYLVQGVCLIPKDFNIQITRLDCLQRCVYYLL